MKPRIAVAAFLAASVLIAIALVLIAFRLGPGGYSAADAQRDRDRLCHALERRFPNDPFICPEIWGDL